MELSAHAIRRARLPAHLGRQVELRAALERWLAARELHRYGLPANAIVLVRELRASWVQIADPVAAIRHDALAAVLRGAQRPALERGSMASTSAVWFADEAELLACMARDALAGGLPARWWWSALLPGDIDRFAVVRHWIASARAVPGASARLEQWGQGAHWLQSWEANARSALLAGLALQYPLATSVQRFVEADQAGSSATAVGQVVSSSPVRLTWPQGSMKPLVDGTVAATARPALAQRLVRLCLALAREPDCAIDARYIERELHFERLQITQHEGRIKHPPNGQNEPTPAAIASLNPAHPMTERRTMAAGSLDPTTPQPEAWRVPLRAAGIDTAHPAPISEADTISPRDITASGAALRATAAPAGYDHAMAFDSQYGGLFFVLNAALQLGLYGDFSQPLQRSLTLSPWQFLHAVGLALGQRQFALDPLATWLKHDLTAAPPWPASDDQAAWCIEPDWLQPFEGDTRPLRALFRDGRLSLLHPAGFVLCEAPTSVDQCEALLATLLARLGLAQHSVQRVAVSLRRPASKPAPPGAARVRLLPYLRARLALALGLRDARALGRVLLRLPARVRAESTRIDVFFALQQLPLAVRLAGLDRDPGWLPAAGRDLRFHFD